MMKKPTVPLMLISSVVAIFVGVICNGMDLSNGFNAMISGFNPSMFTNPQSDAAKSAEIATLVTRGGVISMMNVVITIFCGYAFAAHTKNLSRTLEDAGTMFLPFVPWGTSALFYIEILGVNPSEYWMWAIPCSLAIVFEIIYVIFDITIVRKDHSREELEPSDLQAETV